MSDYTTIKLQARSTTFDLSNVWHILRIAGVHSDEAMTIIQKLQAGETVTKAFSSWVSVDSFFLVLNGYSINLEIVPERGERF